MTKCGFSGCSHEAVYSATMTVGQKQTILTCEDHKPGKARESLPADSPIHKAPLFYEIRAL